MLLGEVIARVSRALTEVDNALRGLHNALSAIEEAADAFDAAVHGTFDHDLFMVLESWRRQRDEIEQAIAAVESIRVVHLRYLEFLGTDSEFSASVISDIVNSSDQPSDIVRSPSGDAYPMQASWGVDRARPYSRPGSKDPVRGLIRTDDGEIIELKPGRGLMVMPAVKRARVAELPEVFWLADICHHVEFQAAAWMLNRGKTETDVIINRTVCFYRKDLEPWRTTGCDEWLPHFLPRGTKLHVYGTDDDGKAVFLKTYEGECDL